MSVSLRPLLKAFLHFGVVTPEAAAPVYSAAAFRSVLPQTHHKRLSDAPVLPINSEREGDNRPAANCYCFPEILGGGAGGKSPNRILLQRFIGREVFPAIRGRPRQRGEQEETNNTGPEALDTL